MPAVTLQRLAKLTRPRTEGLVQRERLFAELDRARSRPLVWIAAPPGAGKTSLVSSYVETRKLTCLWYQLDSGDADPASFFHYAAIAAHNLKFAAKSQFPVFTPDYAHDVAGFGRRFFRELYARVPADTVIVLDNYQDVPEQSPLHAAFAVAAEEAPAGISIVAVSRTPPAVEFARLRAMQRLALIDWHQIRLTFEEASAIAGARRDLAPAIVERLIAQSDGWVAGIVLLLERVRQSGDLKDTVSSENLDTVFDFFAGQIFNASSAQAQDMLLRFSYLPRLTRESAEIVTGQPEAGELLAMLAKRNLFVDRRAGDEITFQFHALFRAFLQERARTMLGAVEHQRAAHVAAGVLQATGLVEDAFPLFIATGAWESAARLILREAAQLVDAGRRQTLREWIRELPVEHFERDPWLVYWLGVAHAGSDLAKGRSLLEQALQDFEKTSDTKGQVLAASALLAGWWSEKVSMAQFEPYLAKLATVLQEGGELDSDTRAVGLTSLLRPSLMTQPANDRINLFGRQLQSLPLEELSPSIAMGAGNALLVYQWGIGDSEAATAAARLAKSHADSPAIAITERVWHYFWMMTHYVYLADADTALSMLERARALSDEANLAPLQLDFVRWVATIEMQLGRPDKARRLLERELAPNLHDASLSTIVYVDLECTRCAIEEHRLADAITHGRRGSALCQSSGYGWAEAVCRMNLCCAYIMAGNLVDAREEIARIRTLVGHSLPILQASMELYEALLCLYSGDRDSARLALTRGMSLRSHTAYVWGPGWNRPAIAELAAFALEEGIFQTEMTRIIKALHLVPPAPDAKSWPWPVRINALSEGVIALESDRPPTPKGKSAHKLLELLKALIAFGGRHVPGTQLADLLWPDADGDAAQKSLETSVHRLRKRLGSEDAILVQDGKISLNDKICHLDLWSFNHLANELEDPSLDADAWEGKAQAALRLYSQHLLADEIELPWMSGPRESVRQRWLQIVRTLGKRLETAKRWQEAAGLYRVAIAIDPSTEDLYRRSMLCLMQMGDDSEFIATYDACVKQLNIHGARPSPETTRLREQRGHR